MNVLSDDPTEKNNIYHKKHPVAIAINQLRHQFFFQPHLFSSPVVWHEEIPESAESGSENFFFFISLLANHNASLTDDDEFNNDSFIYKLIANAKKHVP